MRVILTLLFCGSGRTGWPRSASGCSCGSALVSKESMNRQFSVNGVVVMAITLSASHLDVGISRIIALALTTSPLAKPTKFWSELSERPRKIPYLHGRSSFDRRLFGTNHKIFSPNSTSRSLVSFPCKRQKAVFLSGPSWYLFRRYAEWFTSQVRIAWLDGMGICSLASRAATKVRVCSSSVRTLRSANPLLADSPGCVRPGAATRVDVESGVGG